MPENDLLLRAARREQTERTPVWMMRQAGRFDPEYLAVRDRAKLPLEDMFRDPDLAAEISLLPKRLGVDAIILYQDILTPLTPMGAGFVFRPGPVLETPLRTDRDVEALRPFDPAGELTFVTETLQRIRTALDGELPLLGFAGSPLTLAFFLVEGRSPGRAPEHTRKFMRADPASFRRLLDRLADMTVDYLTMQIEAGVDAIQLFESVGDLVTRSEYIEFAHPYHVKIFSELRDRVPTILFVKEQPFIDLMADSRANVLSVGKCVDLRAARQQYGHKVAFQGNVDNQLLVSGSFEEIDNAVRECVHAGQHTGHILNLNHGLLKETPLENGCRVIETCKATVIGDEQKETASC